MSIQVKVLLMLLSIAGSSSTTVKSGAYHNVVIEVEKDVPVDDCSNFLLSLESSLKSSSEYLHSSLNGRMYFASFDVILPSSWWSSGCVTNTHANVNATNYNGAPTDVKITTRHDIFGDELWTLQTGGCGEKGDQIYAGYKSVEDQKISEKFVLEWMKYRYGVFDIDGFENDSLYPPCGRNDSEMHPVCNEARKIDANPSQSFYNSHYGMFGSFHYANPSKHNFLCNRKNPIDVIMSHPDFNETAVFQSTAHNAPTIRYVKKALTRYMVIIDDHIDLNVRDSFQFLRDAMRKWIEKDVPNKETEVGIWLMGNATKSEDVKRNLIKSLQSSDNREEIFSTLPWYIEYRSAPKCQIHSAITESIQLMKKRARSHGDANSVILIIAPGMFKCSEDSTLSMTNAANEANIKITTINYPNIPTNRIELDQLAQKTGGKSYTIIEERQNEEHSLLTTFFHLTNTLMHISKMYYVGDATPLPVEIYRKELIDSGSREENKPTFDSFNVDEATDNINFFVYIYDRKERNIEKGMKLIAPNNHEFSTSSELRAEYHQLQIVGNLSGYGSWSYNIKRFFGNPQPHFIQVLAYPKQNSNKMIWANAFVRRPLNGGPNIIYAQVMQGNLPINDAFVEMIVIHNGRRVSTKQLFDNGSGEPDITRGDGVYSRYFAVDEPGMYTFKIFASDNGNTAYTSAGFKDFDDDHHEQSCCGSQISTSSKQTVTPFQRYLTPLSLFVSQSEIEQEKSVTPFIGRIGDLRWSQLNESIIIVEWSGPDVGRDDVKINYDIRYSSSLKDMLDDFETLANRWQYVENIPHIVGQVATVTINLADKPSLIGHQFFVAIKSRVDGEATGPISNIARVFVPKRRPTVSPHFSSDSMGDSSGTDLQYETSHDDENEDGIFKNIHRVAGINLEIIIPVVICCFIIIIIISVYCWCCINRNKKFSSAKKNSSKSSPYQQPAISVIVPQTSPVYAAQKTQNQYIPDQMNGSMYYVEAPNHHTVGLPMDDEMAKIDYKEQEKMLYEEMRLQKQFQKQAMMEAYDHDMSMSANGTLTKDSVRYLSPVESWTASQLLHEHERRQSPTEIDQSSMYVDANGEIVPPIPPHPYQNNYGYLPGDISRMPPPQYSYVYRPLARPSLDQGGSMQSVNASISAEKKIRNVTMV